MNNNHHEICGNHSDMELAAIRRDILFKKEYKESKDWLEENDISFTVLRRGYFSLEKNGYEFRFSTGDLEDTPDWKYGECIRNLVNAREQPQQALYFLSPLQGGIHVHRVGPAPTPEELTTAVIKQLNPVPQKFYYIPRYFRQGMSGAQDMKYVVFYPEEHRVEYKEFRLHISMYGKLNTEILFRHKEEALVYCYLLLNAERDNRSIELREVSKAQLAAFKRIYEDDEELDLEDEE